MSSSLPAKIDLMGDHTLAIWLAKSLARRDWIIDSSALALADYTWLGLAYDLIEPLGYDLPVWPLKWNFQHLNLLYRPQAKYALTDWSADLVDLKALQQEPLPICKDKTRASLQIQLNFCKCQETRPQIRSGVLDLTQPVGLLECYESDQDALCLSALDAKRVAYTYLWQTQDLFSERLSVLYPECSPGPLDRDYAACSCWPQVQQEGERLVLQLCRPALSPQNMILQGLAWSLLASLIRWLSLENLNAEQLCTRLSESLHKFEKSQQERLKKHNFFAIPG